MCDARVADLEAHSGAKGTQMKTQGYVILGNVISRVTYFLASVRRFLVSSRSFSAGSWLGGRGRHAKFQKFSKLSLHATHLAFIAHPMKR